MKVIQLLVFAVGGGLVVLMLAWTLGSVTRAKAIETEPAAPQVFHFNLQATPNHDCLYNHPDRLLLGQLDGMATCKDDQDCVAVDVGSHTFGYFVPVVQAGRINDALAAVDAWEKRARWCASHVHTNQINLSDIQPICRKDQCGFKISISH